MMPSRLLKLFFQILVSSFAAFILFSVSVSSEEPTRCYWCGPLAEQVHRSQRAPSCDGFTHEQHETVCDKGYTHCAIVAVSPPYAESRLCVKFYQDECYSLYCNSTRTWRMVCACRGNLCNGPHTERETQAFALVPKFIAKTKPRNKRSLISGFISVKTKTPSDNNTIIIMGQNDSANFNMRQKNQSEQTHTTEIIMSAVTKNIVDVTMSDEPKRVEDNVVIEHETVMKPEKTITHKTPNESENNEEHRMLTNPPTMPPLEDKHVQNVTKPDTHLDNQMDRNTNNVEKDKNVNDSEIDKQTNKVKTGKQLNITEMDKQTPILEFTTPANFVRVSDEPTTEFTSMKSTNIEIEVAVINIVTPKKMPPPESLQQNVTPTKAMEATTIGTVSTSTENNRITETETTIPYEMSTHIGKSNGKQNVGHLLIVAIFICIHYSL